MTIRLEAGDVRTIRLPVSDETGAPRPFVAGDILRFVISRHGTALVSKRLEVGVGGEIVDQVGVTVVDLAAGVVDVNLTGGDTLRDAGSYDIEVKLDTSNGGPWTIAEAELLITPSAVGVTV